jgi:hypothetical protein
MDISDYKTFVREFVSKKARAIAGAGEGKP